jgi:exodeoxyribonuclease VII large subunit
MFRNFGIFWIFVFLCFFVLWRGENKTRENKARSNKQLQLEKAASKLNALSPLNTLSRGFSIVTRGDSNADVVTRSDQVNVGDTITARLSSGRLKATVTQKANEKESENET